MEYKTIGTWVWANGRIYTLWFKHPANIPEVIAKSSFLHDIREAARNDAYITLGLWPIQANQITAIYFEA